MEQKVGWDELRIIDTHLHLIEPERFNYPWTADEPGLQKTFDLTAYRREAMALGITAMLHMEVSVPEDEIEAETAHVTGLGQGVIGAIAGCRPTRADFPAVAGRLAANPRVKGLRHVFQGNPAIYDERLLAENLRRLATLGLTFDLCIYGPELPRATALAADCPEVQFILDHCGKPGMGPLDQWRRDITAIARLPNVVCKFSGLHSYAAPPDWSLDDLRPAAEHVIAAFGFDRLVWGSDWPVCTLTGSLTRWVEATHALIEGASPDEKRRLFSANAERVYRLA
ncbi:amidohydrolase family protein [Chelatococcus sp. GCM10030263]|uniref:amidohydrolase family protein n=1 Tax=Chelatococcus sp. GCM10030263 TaxID=3273387 RepID=UPI0036087C53